MVEARKSASWGLWVWDTVGSEHSERFVEEEGRILEDTEERTYAGGLTGLVKVSKAERAKADAARVRAFEKEELLQAKAMLRARPNPVKEEERKRRAAAAKLRAADKKEKEAMRRAEEITRPGYIAPKTGRPFGAVGGYWKPWMKRVAGKFYTDTLLVHDLIMLAPKDRLEFLTELDPKTIGEGSPEEIAAKIKAALDAIQKSVPAPK